MTALRPTSLSPTGLTAPSLPKTTRNSLLVPPGGSILASRSPSKSPRASHEANGRLSGYRGSEVPSRCPSKNKRQSATLVEVKDLVLPPAPPPGLQEYIVGQRKLYLPNEIVEIRLVREEAPIKAPGHDQPGDVQLDLRHLASLRRVHASPDHGIVNLQRLDLSHCLQFVGFPTGFFSNLPDLRELSLRGCVAVPQIIELETARRLERLDLSKCKALCSLRMKGSQETRLAPQLRFVDLDGCSMLPDVQAWSLIGDKVRPEADDPDRVAGIPAQAVNRCVLPAAPAVGCSGAHCLSRFDVGKAADAQCSNCLSTMAKHTHMQACLTCNFFVCHPCVTREKAASVGVVWSSHSRLKAFEAARGSQAEELSSACREGVREKLRLALEAAQAAISDDFTDSVEAELVEELQDAVRRTREIGLVDTHLFKKYIEAVARFLPDTLLPCLNGCNQEVCAKDWVEHDAECDRRLVPCPLEGCEQLVPQAYLKHHIEVETELRSSLETWDLVRIKRALHVAKFHCSGCRLPGDITNKAEGIYWHLNQKIKRLRETGVLGRGNVSVDYNECTIHIQKEIPFEDRAPPDSSAVFKEGCEKDAATILFDLCEVIKTFQKAMVVEGHTGGTEPAAYWQELANNRSRLITEMLADIGVPPLLAIPKGCPGGGAKVLCKPAKMWDVFEVFDTDASGTLSSSELRQAREALGQWLTEHQLNDMILGADQDKDGVINVPEFCAKFGLLTGLLRSSCAEKDAPAPPVEPDSPKDKKGKAK